ncbi:HTH-type transcriptional repressor RspR [subsurface metagenome]
MEKLFVISDYELLSKKVYRVLKSKIIKGSFEPGDKLLENRISKQLGVSRTPVREALRQLAAAGFVKMIPNQAIIVNDISIKDLREVLQIRGVLEGLAAWLAAFLITKEKIKVLETCNENMEKLIGQNNIIAFVKESNKFHSVILEICENNRLIQIRENLADQVYKYRNISLHIPGRLESALKEHKEITEALKQGNADKADALSKTHIANVLKNILSHKDEKLKVI